MMNKHVFLVFFLFGLVSNVASQSKLNDYSYVIVPEQFEILNQKDKYQLNSIAEFLFNKHGFHAFKSNKTPNAKRCDGLYADVIKVTAMLRTKLVVVLNDCDGNEVYRTAEGISKIKEFKRAYQDALRKAFLSFEGMNVQQKEIVYFGEEEPTKVEPVVAVAPVVIEEPKAVNEIALEPTNSDVSAEVSLPVASFTSYSYGGIGHILRKTEQGYFLYEESADSEGGLLLKGRVEAVTADNMFFIDTDDNMYKASFDASHNLTILKGHSTVVYRRVR